jgi:hypothetical protein
MFGLHIVSLAIGVGIGAIPQVAIWVHSKFAKVEAAVAPAVAAAKSDVTAAVAAVEKKI